jgi:DNA-binding LacI/PurR family transcriptional regulator
VKEVAALARVSTATVSRVLSGNGIVRDELALKVQEAARKLNYKPNRVARSLRSRGTRIIGIVIPDIENPYFAAVITGIEDILLSADYCLLLAHYQDSVDREQVLLETLHCEGVAGLIFTPSTKPSPLYRELAQAGVGLVALAREAPELGVDSVSLSGRQGTYDGVRHLLGLGHRRIALINGPATSSTATERYEGYTKAHQDAGLPVAAELVRNIEWKQESAYRAFQALLDIEQRPTAVFTGSNLLTLGALQAIHEKRLEIPKDIALVGFDDLPWAISLRPSLTVISYEAREMGRCAAQMLLERIAKPSRPPVHREFPTKLIVRASCGAQWDW